MRAKTTARSSLLAAVITNMIAPYRARVFEQVAQSFPGNFVVIVCAHRERGRDWTIPDTAFQKIELRRAELSIGRFSIHSNIDIISTLRDLSPDVICVGGFTPTMSIAMLYAISKGIPFVLMIDGWLKSDMLFPNPMHRALRRFFVPRASAGIGASEKTKQWFHFYGLSPRKFFLSPLIPAWPAPREIPSYSDRPYDLLWCGHVCHDKGIDIFVDVVASLRTLPRPLSVRVVGEGPRLPWCKARLQKEPVAVRFDGFVQGPEVRAAFASAKLFLFPTRFDTWGLVANEALQCGTPVLISNTAGAADELVRNGVEGCVLPPDAPLWTTSTLELLTDPAEWALMSRNAVARTARLSVEGSASAIMAALAAALRSKESRDP